MNLIAGTTAKRLRLTPRCTNSLCTKKQVRPANVRPLSIDATRRRFRATNASPITTAPSAITAVAPRRGSISRRYLATSPRTSPMEQHNKTVEGISTAVRQFYERKEKFRIFHGSTNSTRNKPTKNLVNTSSLRHFLSIDKENKTCLVEPNVSMDRLVEATLREGLVPPVVMEFPGITVGGGYSGTSGESSSFKHGFFDQTINWIEMVLANGDIVRLSKSDRADLFHGAAGAVGTFGVTTLVELQLQEAKKFVETTYTPVKGMKDAIAKLQTATNDPELDYVDGIMFTKSDGAIITGRLTNESETGTSIQTFSNAKDPWFYLHVKDAITKSKQPTTELIPLAEYFFRYDRGGFWVGASAFEYFKFPFNKITRWFLDDFLHTRMMYTALHASGYSKRYVVQDLALPYSTAEQFVDYTDEAFGIYPLWLCPLKQNSLPTMHPHSNEYEADGKTLKKMLNIGLWGNGPQRIEHFVTLNKDLEQKLKELGGMKWLYAHTYYDEDQFWEMFDRSWYEGLRKKYDAESLPTVYEKVKVNVDAEKKEVKDKSMLRRLATVWPFAGFYGIKKAIESKTYLEARKATWRSKPS